MTAPKSRARRRPCKVCGKSEAQHPPKAKHAYEPIDPTPYGVHRTARLDLKIPDPEGHEARWRDAAEAFGTSLGDFCRRALDAYASHVTPPRK